MAAYQEGMNGIQMKPHKLRVSCYDIWMDLKYGSFEFVLIVGDIILAFWVLYDGIFYFVFCCWYDDDAIIIG